MTHTHSRSHSHDPDRGSVSIGRLVFRVILAAVIVGLLVAYSMCFQVTEGHHAVVTRFGDPVRSVHEAGLFWKWPWPIEQAHPVDVRRHLHNTPYTATFTRDRRNVVLLTYVVWHVDDPLLYLQSVGNRQKAEDALNGIVVHYKNEFLGDYDLSALVSVKPEDIKTAEIEKKMLAAVAREAREKFGIEVEQVGIKRLAYPEENIPSVLEQMKAERLAEARTLRAEGQREAQRIRDDAARKKAETLRKGVEEAAQITARADTQAAQIWNEANRLDPDFYKFWSKLRTIKKVLGSDDTLILRNDQPPFDVLQEAPGALLQVAPEAPRAAQAAPGVGASSPAAASARSVPAEPLAAPAQPSEDPS